MSHNYIAGSGVQIIEVTYFLFTDFFGFSIDRGSGPIFKVEFSLLSTYGKIELLEKDTS